LISGIIVSLYHPHVSNLGHHGSSHREIRALAASLAPGTTCKGLESILAVLFVFGIRRKSSRIVTLRDEFYFDCVA
jgi:hypothetical protein